MTKINKLKWKRFSWKITLTSMCFCVSIVLHNFVQVFNCNFLYQLRFLHNLDKTISKEKCYLLIGYFCCFIIRVCIFPFLSSELSLLDRADFHAYTSFILFFMFRSSDKMLLVSLLLSVCHRIRSQQTKSWIPHIKQQTIKLQKKVVINGRY